MVNKSQWMMMLLAVAVASTCQAAIITSATHSGGASETPNILTPLAEGSEAYVDETHVLVNVPTELEDADLVQFANADRRTRRCRMTSRLAT